MFPAAFRFAAVATLAFLCACDGIGAVDAPSRVAPTRPLQIVGVVTAPEPKVTRIGEIDYVNIEDVAARFRLKLTWGDLARKVTLTDPTNTIEVAAGGREGLINGLRIFFGDKTVVKKGQLYFGKIDFDRCLVPLLRPGQNVSLISPPKIIAIDPGHGGTDAGGVNPRLGLLEKTFTLAVALRLKPLLEKAGYKVVMTRVDDRLPAPKPADLAARAEIANREKADLFISIHFNVVLRDPQNTRGVEIYTFPPAHQHATDWWSEQPKEDPLFETKDEPGNRYDHWNVVAAQALHRQMLQTLNAEDRGKKLMHLGVLRALNCPGVLVEPAIITNDAEARRIATPEYQQKIAEALAAGVRDYSATLESLRPKPAASTATTR